MMSPMRIFGIASLLLTALPFFGVQGQSTGTTGAPDVETVWPKGKYNNRLSLTINYQTAQTNITAPILHLLLT